MIEGDAWVQLEARGLSTGAEVENGRFRIARIPAGSDITLTAVSGNHWRLTRRLRVFDGMFRQDRCDGVLTVNFGGPSTAEDPFAPPFSLVPYDFTDLPKGRPASLDADYDVAVFPAPRPDATLTPPTPCWGERARLAVTALPPGEKVEIWLHGLTLGGFKTGHPYHPGGIWLGEEQADERGALTFDFTMKADYLDALDNSSGTGLPYAELWLVFPRTPERTLPVQPMVARWECDPAATPTPR